MSWRVVAVVMISVFALLAVWSMTTGPLHDVTSKIVDVSDDNSDVQQQVDEGTSAYATLVIILVGGTLVWAAWRVLRRELTRGQL